MKSLKRYLGLLVVAVLVLYLPFSLYTSEPATEDTTEQSSTPSSDTASSSSEATTAALSEPSTDSSTSDDSTGFFGDDFFDTYDPNAPVEPPKIAEPKLPEISQDEIKAIQEKKTAALVSIDVPGLGVLNLEPFQDTTKSPPEGGLRVVFADNTKKVSLGALDIDEGQIQLVAGKLGMTGRATLFGNKARFGAKEIDFVAEKKFVKRILLGVDFIDKPSFEIIPGVADSRVELTNVEVEIERDKPIVARALNTVFGQKVVLSFLAEKDYVDASLKLADTPLKNLIAAVDGTPLATAIVKNAGLTLENIYAKDRATRKFTTVIGGTVDLTPVDLGSTSFSDSAAVSNTALSCKITSASVEGTITAQRFPLADIGTINKAEISIKAGAALHEQAKEKADQEKASITLSGDLTFNVSDTGNLNVVVASKISNKGFEFLGELKEPLSYLDVTLNKGKVLFDTKKKLVDIVGDVTFQGLTLAATFALKPDPAALQDTTRRIIEFTAKAQAKKFEPFAGTGIPGLETLTFTDLDSGVEIISKPGQPVSKAIVLKGDVNILNVSLRSIIKFVGQNGVYIDAPLPKDWTFSQSIPALKGPVFDGLVFKEASFVASNVDYTDTVKNITVRKGLQFYAEVPLSGTLQPVADFLGSSGQTFTMFGTITPNPRNMVFGIKLGKGMALGTRTDAKPPVEIGDTEIIIAGTPSFGLKANVLVRPSEKDELLFSGLFDLSATEASMDVSMNGMWHNPFGVNGLSLGDVALVLGIKYGAPLPTKFGVAAALQVTNTKVGCKVIFDAGLEHMALEGNVNKLSLVEILNGLAKPIGFTLPVDPDVPLFDLRDVYVRFAATDTKIGNAIIAQGLTLQGKMDLLAQEKAAELDVNIDTSGIKIKGYTQPINLQGLLKVSGLSGEESPCAPKEGKKGCATTIKMQGGSGQDRPEVDIELTLARQVFLVQGAMVLGDEASGAFYKTATCMCFSRGGIAFEFLSQIGGDNLLKSHVLGESSGSFTDPQFKLSIDFEQHLQDFIKEQVTTAFTKAQQEVVNGINTAQQEINKIDSVIEDSKAKIAAAEREVQEAKKALDVLKDPIKKSDEAFAAAQNEVNSINKQIADLNAWWNGLPKY